MKKITLLMMLLIGFYACKSDEPVSANFEYTIADEGKVTFKNTSVNATTYEWDFGNGNKSIDMNTSTQYIKNGDYSVVLISKGKSNQDTKILKVTISNASKSTIKFSYKSLGNGVIQFTNDSQNADSFKWTFGNNLTSTERAPQTTYSINGTYEVKLEATNFNGTTELKQNITIADAPKPVADFSKSGESNGTVSFTNNSSNSDSFLWTFGNGQTSTQRNPSVTYSANGNYSVTLTAKNANGENTTSKTISVSSIYVPTTGQVVFWTNFGSIIKIYINNNYQGQLSKYIISGLPSCGLEGFVTVDLPQGAYSFTAQEDKLFPLKWSGTINVTNGQCKTQQLTK